MRLFQLIPPWSIDIWTSVQPNRQKKKWPQFRIISSTLSNRRKVTLLQILHRTAYDLLQKYEIAESASDCRRNHALRKSRPRRPFSAPATDPAVREKIGAELNEKGLPALYERLRSVDPKTADRLAPADTQRITRALEVFEMTGKPISELTAQKGEPLLKLSSYALLPPDRAALHARIAERFELMIKNGFLDEVKKLMAMPGMHADLPSMRSVGYRQAWNYLSGLTTFDAFKEAGIAATRQLAKASNDMDALHAGHTAAQS